MKTEKTQKIRIRFCPKCKDERIIPLAGGQIGIFQCVNCRFQSPIFPEREIELGKKEKLKIN